MVEPPIKVEVIKEPIAPLATRPELEKLRKSVDEAIAVLGLMVGARVQRFNDTDGGTKLFVVPDAEKSLGSLLSIMSGQLLRNTAALRQLGEMMGASWDDEDGFFWDVSYTPAPEEPPKEPVEGPNGDTPPVAAEVIDGA